ncbi:histidine-containing phosphotransfer protein 4 [Quercus suber]|uniref:Histidine-containing phosphotransfer protein n=1 Tax=Quercus suber TaxID=58331 RepID=A0AAW0KPM5_QUESU
MERNQMRRQLALIRQSFFDQGFLDEQFIQLEELQDDANPNFVEEVVTLYYRDSSRLILNIDQALERNPLDFNKLDNYMHQFKGSSTSIGAKKVKAECTQFREYCKAGNSEGRCMRTFQQLKKEYAILKRKLEAYFQQARQAGPLETACRSRN